MLKVNHLEVAHFCIYNNGLKSTSIKYHGVYKKTTQLFCILHLFKEIHLKNKLYCRELKVGGKSAKDIQSRKRILKSAKKRRLKTTSNFLSSCSQS